MFSVLARSDRQKRIRPGLIGEHEHSTGAEIRVPLIKAHLVIGVNRLSTVVSVGDILTTLS